MLKNPNLRNFHENGFRNIEGWCNEQVLHVVDRLDDAPINKKGGCLEIGVHHGVLYILLNQVIQGNQKSYAVDLFEMQELNIDNSGLGSLEKFKKNLQLYDAHAGANTHIIQGDSTDPALELERIVGRASLRFISIDGGHSVEHTISDLKLANVLIANEGIVILDDILNYHWLGVIEGFGRFISGFPTLVPVAIGANKLYLCKISVKSIYYQLFAQSPLRTKEVTFYGHKIVAL
jgi:methyltransferase family protein